MPAVVKQPREDDSSYNIICQLNLLFWTTSLLALVAEAKFKTKCLFGPRPIRLGDPSPRRARPSCASAEQIGDEITSYLGGTVMARRRAQRIPINVRGLRSVSI